MRAASDNAIERLLRKIQLGPTTRSTLVVAATALASEASQLEDGLKSRGVDAVAAEIRADLSSLNVALQRSEGLMLILTADDAVGEPVWRMLDERRSLLINRPGDTVLLASDRAAQSMRKNAVHLASMFEEPIQLSPRHQLETLIKTGKIGEARRFAEKLDPKEIAPLDRLLELPKTSLRPKSGRGDSAENTRWLREHAKDYPKQWVVLRDGQLVDHGSTLAELRARLTGRSDFRDLLWVKTDTL